MKMKQAADRLINGVLLKRLGMKLSFRIGSDPFDDIARLMSSNPVTIVVDGGAYEGSFSLAMAKAFPHATIYAFEPTPSSHERLAQVAQSYPQIEPHRLAIGAQSGKATFFANASPLTNSLRKSSDVGRQQFRDLVTSRDEFEVEVIALADFARVRGIAGFDVVKFDLQGQERDALLGMGDLVGRTQVALIEVQFVAVYEDAPLFSDVEVMLREKGLLLYQFYELVRSPTDGRLLYGDALFVNPDLLAKPADHTGR